MSKQRELLYKDGSPMREYTSKIIEELMNEDKKQTAVEWLQFKINDFLFVTLAEERKLKDLFVQAKAIEKEQIEIAFDLGRDELGCKLNDIGTGEKYYNETYANE